MGGFSALFQAPEGESVAGLVGELDAGAWQVGKGFSPTQGVCPPCFTGHGG